MLNRKTQTSQETMTSAYQMKTLYREFHNGIDYSQWVTVVSLILLFTILLVGSCGNAFGLIVSCRQKRATATKAFFTVFFIINLLTTLVCCPMVIAGFINTDVVTESFCYVQETLTFFTACVCLTIPSFWSLETLDRVVRHNKRCLSPRRSSAVVGVTVPVVLLCSTLPLFAFTSPGAVIHEHGCHWWSTTVDDYVWYQFYILAVLVCLSTTVQILSYAVVFGRVKTHEKSFRHKRNTVVPSSGTTVSVVSETNGPSQQQETRPPMDGQGLRNEDNIPPRQPKMDPTHNSGHYRSLQRSVALMSIFIICTFMICWLPWLVLNILVQYRSYVDPQLRVFTMVIGYLTSLFEPMIVITISRDHKEVCLKLISFLRNKLRGA